MKNFLKGLVVGSIGLAIIQNTVQTLNGIGDLISNKLQIRALKDQKEAALITKEIEGLSNCNCEEPVATSCIGFTLPEETLYDDEEECKGARKKR